MSKKAFVCFCVDGQSDIDALREPFSDLFDYIGGTDINVEFRLGQFNQKERKNKGGDLTSQIGVHPENVEQQLYKYYFRLQDKGSGLGWSDLTHIIHIIDLDGAFIDEQHIELFTDQEKEYVERLSSQHDEGKTTLYYDTHIAARDDRQHVIQRNERKKRIIEKLLTLDRITIGRKVVKYSIYYFSSNIDHLLYGDANLGRIDKMVNASRFSDEHYTWQDLADFFDQCPYCSKLDYETSWNEVKKRNHSLLRGTNVNLLFNRILHSDLEDWL